MHEFVAKNRDKVELFLDESKLEEVIRRKKPTKFFWCDMTDIFLDDYPDGWIDKCFAAMALSPQHTHQVLTKRAERMNAHLSGAGYFPDRVYEAARGCYSIDQLVTLARLLHGTDPIRHLPNVWLMVSVEDQRTADERIPWLLQTPASTRGVSYEPALGPIDFTEIKHNDGEGDIHQWNVLTGEAWVLDSNSPSAYTDGNPKLDWVIVGGESGYGARPFDLRWARDTIAQCKAAGIACFVKQLGRRPYVFEANPPFSLSESEQIITGDILLEDKKGGFWSEWPGELRVRQMPEVNQ